MPRFLTGDELGNIKCIHYPEHQSNNASPKLSCTTILDGMKESRPPIQALATSPSSDGSRLVVAGFANGSASAFSINDDIGLRIVSEWKESRFKPEERYVGLHAFENKIYSCLSNGVLRLTGMPSEDVDTQTCKPVLASLPTRLSNWRISENQDAFAYGGDEVELSVWSTELAFSHIENGGNGACISVSASSRKRKRVNSFFPGEIWRAKNVRNDSLGLRQPVHITCLNFISSTPSGHKLIAGTQSGKVRLYETRVAHRPVADWDIAHCSGIKVLEKGHSEHEVFVSDTVNHLYALDLRTGRIIYGYKGISGAVTSIAPAQSFMASTALDRYTRIHATHPSPPDTKQLKDQKGEIVDKLFMKSVPTVIIWDKYSAAMKKDKSTEDDNMWDNMRLTHD